MQLPSAREEAYPAEPRMLADLLLSSQCWGSVALIPALAIGPSAGGRREVSCPPHASHSACPPSSPSLGPTSSVWGLILHPAPGPHFSLGCARLSSLPTLDSQHGWGGRILGAGRLVPGFGAKPCEGPWLALGQRGSARV